MTLKTVFASLATTTALLFATASNAALVFESDAATGSSNRSAQSGIMTRIEVSNTVHLTNFAVQMDLNTAGNVKFVIFNSLTGSLLFDSGVKAFADDGDTFKLSDAFSFDLLAGTRYALGVLSDVGSIQDYVVPGGKTMGDITSLGSNQNASGFASPTFDAGLAGTDGRIRLFADAGTTVPEPSSVLLMALGLLAVGVVRRKA
jgi:hypothetical protein